MCVIGILAALHHRDRVGEGQFVDVSMTDGIVSWLALQASDYFAGGRVEPRPGEMRLNGSLLCYRIYATRDGRHVTMGALEPKFWEAFCRAVEKSCSQIRLDSFQIYQPISLRRFGRPWRRCLRPTSLFMSVTFPAIIVWRKDKTSITF